MKHLYIFLRLILLTFLKYPPSYFKYNFFIICTFIYKLYIQTLKYTLLNIYTLKHLTTTYNIICTNDNIVNRKSKLTRDIHLKTFIYLLRIKYKCSEVIYDTKINMTKNYFQIEKEWKMKNESEYIFDFKRR